MCKYCDFWQFLRTSILYFFDLFHDDHCATSGPDIWFKKNNPWICRGLNIWISGSLYFFRNATINFFYILHSDRGQHYAMSGRCINWAGPLLDYLFKEAWNILWNSLFPNIKYHNSEIEWKKMRIKFHFSSCNIEKKPSKTSLKVLKDISHSWC